MSLSTISISAYFYGGPGDPLDKACRSIFETYGGKSVGTGTVLSGATAGERAEDCRAALKKAGFRLYPTPEEIAPYL